MSEFRVFLSLEVLTALKALRGVDRILVGRFIEGLAKDPFQEGDYQERDPTGRPIEIKIVGRYAVFYWNDHPVREVKIVSLKKADKP